MEENHGCKLCGKTFVNGRALGGHMRSHMAAMLPKKEVLSYSSSSSSEGEGSRGAGYGLRENPKKSVKVVDPEFSFAVVDAGSVVHDRESESEAEAVSPRRRSKLRRRSVEVVEELASSVSDTTPEEDVALCLMMLSRDIWLRRHAPPSFEVEEESEPDPPPQPPAKLRRHKFQCGTCKKVFRSYQALGGHRASHKKSRACLPAVAAAGDADVAGEVDAESDQPKVHQCPFCYRVFNSGQALGGHKRSHLSGAGAAGAPAGKMVESLIDLNLPAPVEEDQASQVELSAVSDVVEFGHY